MSHSSIKRRSLPAAFAFLAIVAPHLAASQPSTTGPAVFANVEAAVSVEVGPAENGRIAFARIASNAAGEPDGSKLAPILFVTNNGDEALTLLTARVEFIGSPVAFAAPITFDVHAEIEPGQTRTIHLQDHPDYVEDEDDYDTYTIKLPFPPPPAVNIVLDFEGFPMPTEVFRQLTEHENDAPQGAYRFPGKAADLGANQFWSGRSDFISGKHGGNERFAYDIGVSGWVADDGGWSRVIPGTSQCENENWLVWDKPVYAVADGVVTQVNDGAPDRDPTVGNCVGTESMGANQVLVRHDEEIVHYLHLRQNSIVVAEGDIVQAGDMLGRVGNSGSTSNPHLHIDVVRPSDIVPDTSTLRPMHFRCAQTVAQSEADGNPAAAPWSQMDGHALPWDNALVWPSPDAGFAEVARHGIPEAAYQATFDHITACDYMPVWVDGYSIGTDVGFNAIFRPADTAWIARHGLTAGQYQAEFDTWTEQGYRPHQVESYLEDGRIRYAVIFMRESGPAWVAYHGLSASQHQARFDELVRDGYHAVNISVVSIAGQRRYTALYELGDIGAWEARSFLTPQQYQATFDANVEAGRALAYVQGYVHQGRVRFSAIWRADLTAEFNARHGLTGDGYQEHWEEATGDGFLTRAVTGYDQNGQLRFAGLWRRPD